MMHVIDSVINHLDIAIEKLIAKEAVDMCIKLKETYTRFNETMALVPDLLMEQWRCTACIGATV